MLVRQNRLLSEVLSTLGQCFVSFQPVLYRPHTQTRVVLFSRLPNKHSQIGTFSQPCSDRTFSNSFSHNSLAKGWPYRFRSRGTTGSSMLDHDLGHLCFATRIQISGHSDSWNFSVTSVHLPFWPGCKRILRLLLVVRILVALLWHPWLLQPSFVMLMIFAQ